MALNKRDSRINFPLYRLAGAISVLLIITALIYFRSELIRWSLRLTGERIQVRKYSLRILCKGERQPPVIMDAGLTHGISTWKRIFTAVAKSTKVCAYDRAGIGGSDDPDEIPRTSLNIVEDLEILLSKSGINGPYFSLVIRLAR